MRDRSSLRVQFTAVSLAVVVVVSCAATSLLWWGLGLRGCDGGAFDFRGAPTTKTDLRGGPGADQDPESGRPFVEFESGGRRAQSALSLGIPVVVGVRAKGVIRVQVRALLLRPSDTESPSRPGDSRVLGGLAFEVGPDAQRWCVAGIGTRAGGSGAARLGTAQVRVFGGREFARAVRVLKSDLEGWSVHRDDALMRMEPGSSVGALFVAPADNDPVANSVIVAEKVHYFDSPPRTIIPASAWSTVAEFWLSPTTSVHPSPMGPPELTPSTMVLRWELRWEAL